jgi:hypothetical protein
LVARPDKTVKQLFLDFWQKVTGRKNINVVYSKPGDIIEDEKTIYVFFFESPETDLSKDAERVIKYIDQKAKNLSNIIFCE